MESTSQHLLALKVMRVSRPALASAWEPFYSSSPSFSARSTASIVSLQGKEPLVGHPKTLRDLSNASELLTLPSSFGAIQLGETFSSCLSVNNEAGVDVSSVLLKIEMQTATTKIGLAEIRPGTDGVLKAGDTIESIVHHEIKELGQHVLACTVSYRVPPGVRRPPAVPEDVNDPDLLTFRKFYKFAVTNPLSVKTKVHVPRSPSALVSQTEREKVFLEVHIQNLTQDALWFQRIAFECAEGWNVLDTNTPENTKSDDLMFKGAMALMQPQDMRQYIYILSPISVPDFPVTLPPGSVVSLGRLDICWRSSYGEPGRLLTSMLTRRIPLLSAVTAPGVPVVAPAKSPISALPLHMQRSASVGPGPPRPRSPQLPVRSQTPPVPTRPQSPGTVLPPHRPGSPFRVRTLMQPPTSPPAVTLQLPPQLPPTNVQVDLTAYDFSHDSIIIEKPFAISFRLAISAPVPPGRNRMVAVAVQHVMSMRTSGPTMPVVSVAPPVVIMRQETLSGRSTPSPTGSPHRGEFDFPESLSQRLLVASPRVMYRDEVDDESLVRGDNTVVLPPPFGGSAIDTSGVEFFGASAIFLGFVALNDANNKIASHEVSLTYLPLEKGFSKVGGLRILLVGDYLDGEEVKEEVLPLKEWDVIAEVWVQG